MATAEKLTPLAPGVASASRKDHDWSREGAGKIALLAMIIAGMQGILAFLVLEGFLMEPGVLSLSLATGISAILASVFGWVLGRHLWQSFAGGLRDLPAALRKMQRGHYETRLPAEGSGPAAESCRAVNRILDSWDLQHQHLVEHRIVVERAIKSMTNTLSRHQAGERDSRCDLKGDFAELGLRLNQTLEELGARDEDLANISQGIGHSAEQVRLAAHAAHGDALAQREVCAATSEDADQLKVQNQRLTSLCQEAIDSSSLAEQAGKQSQSAISDLNAGMEGLQRETRAATVKIKRLGERSMQIAAITGTISKMSAQTDMLALNAAIEASRAGEQGHGFTVVAEEVRKLAEKASQAAKEVDRLIRGIQNDIGEAVGGMDRQGERIEMHSAAAAAAERSIQKLRQEAESAHAAVDAVTHTATSQCAAADQIESALEQIENVARKLEVAEETTRHRSEALLELCLTIQQPNSVAPSV
ncbi:MAG: methyl-accepting chemotaxis protein [Candidatus Binatia bacterium]|nr:methyl-accepting chemotaxis protein [Candidatus Binatia bacterium]MDG1959832.1 methyl-accepting chemotaxis protein [Candidatus Binatia bacterium]MDG2010107.1 methyl-accepting chemotaxis protein [Candidatus Binatia bacterium]HAC79095.1 hypothetical protein [Deltaproteobacteria bacterium]